MRRNDNEAGTDLCLFWIIQCRTLIIISIVIIWKFYKIKHTEEFVMK